MGRYKTWLSNASPAQTPPLPVNRTASSMITAAALANAAANYPNGFESHRTQADSLSSTQRKRMKAFLKQCRAHPQHSQIGCDSYLLMPIQRVPRYKMLLEALLSCTPVDDGSYMLSPNPRIAAALELVTHLATDLNERKRESEGRQRLLYYQSRIGQKFKSPLVQVSLFLTSL